MLFLSMKYGFIKKVDPGYILESFITAKAKGVTNNINTLMEWSHLYYFTVKLLITPVFYFDL